MGCCETLMRAILVIINIVVSVAGAVMLIVGGVFLAKGYEFFDGTDMENYSVSVDPVVIPMMVMGGILLLVGLIGCAGACSGKGGLLNVYFVIIGLVVIAELVVLIYGYIKKDDVKEAMEDGVTQLFIEYHGFAISNNMTISEDKILAVNTFQRVLGCCGIDKPSYWLANGNTKYPPGCCDTWDGENYNKTTGLQDCPEADVYKVGCREQTNSVLNDLGIIIIIIILAVIVFEIFCMIAACIAKKNDYLSA